MHYDYMYFHVFSNLTKTSAYLTWQTNCPPFPCHRL